MQSLNKGISLERKKGAVLINSAHSDQIISISVSPSDNNIFATSSDDQTIRIWDLRTSGSVKLIKTKAFINQLSNCVLSNKQQVYVGCGKQVYGFQLRKQAIFVNEHNYVSKQHHDDINHIAFDKGFKYLGACDDMGDTRLYNPTLEMKANLDQKHTNVSFCLDFLNPQNKPAVCVTSGFDCRIVFWNPENEEPIRQIEIAPIFNQHVSIHSMPLIYSVLGLQSSVLIGTETGHIACFNSSGSKQPRLLFAANLNKILRMCFANFKKNILITLNGQETFCLFDYEKRDQYGAPKMLQKVSTKAMGNWIQTAPNNVILVADKTNELSIFKLKD